MKKGVDEDPAELQKKLEDNEIEQKRISMLNEAYRNEINRVNFNKIVRKQIDGDKRRNGGDDANERNKLLAATDRPGDSEDDGDMSQESEESGKSAGGSSQFATERSEEAGGKAIPNAKMIKGGKGKSSKTADATSTQPSKKVAS